MVESDKVSVINATQKTDLQIVPNMQYDYNSKAKVEEFSKKSVEERKKIVAQASIKFINGNNKKQRPRGFYFDEQGFSEDVYIVEENHDILITNEMECSRHMGKHLSISVRYLNGNNKTVQKFYNSARKLGKLWEKEGNMTNRSVISGVMKHFGTMLGAGNQVDFSYAPTRHNKKGVNSWHAMVNVAANSIAKQHFPKAWEDIHRTMKDHHMLIPAVIGGQEGLCCEMVQSQHALVTEPHVDLDYSKCISIWTVEPGKELKTKGWFFVLPYLTCNVDGKEFTGIAVKLRHGAGIEWDGRYVFHCSTSPKDETINVHGTFFGITHI